MRKEIIITKTTTRYIQEIGNKLSLNQLGQLANSGQDIFISNGIANVVVLEVDEVM